ncbi:MAG TPA: GMC family oxidoreductase [Thermodesulfobacteriota bacterium]|nr:GMC family oxidoreductase [Thermodesulfobacteriota bacterium]
MSQKNKKYDCIVIGSGPGGAPFAWRLASKGMNVLVLETGDRYDPHKDYPLTKDDWEKSGFPYRKKLRLDFGKSQSLDEKYAQLKSWNKASGKLNPSSERVYHRYQHVLGVGGTTLHFQGEAHRLHPSAFRMKSLFGVAEDWPVSYEDIEPYYSEVEKILGVAGPEEIPGRPRSVSYPLPPHKLSYASQVIGKGCKELGLELLPNSVAILSIPYRETPPCNYCNGCVWGCPRKDKGTVDVTFVPLAENTGRCEILTNSFVSRIEVEKKNGRKRAKGVLYRDRDGKEQFVEGDYIAVACGAVETPRLLLNSGLSGNGVVGKNFMETVFYQVVAFHPERLDSYRGIPIDGVIWKWNEPSKELGFKGGFRLFATVGSAVGPVNYALRYQEGWGEEFVKGIEKWFGHAVSMGGIGEFLPNKDTFVTVSETVKDEFGVPVAKIQSFLEDPELKIMDAMAKTSKEILRASGAEEIVEESSAYDFFNATHVFGTCRMGKNPETSVVGSDLRSHEVDNLLVTDASVFPSSGGGDAPSLTIEALSLRAADLLLENLKKG